jgi:hypothetical protein
MHGTCRYAEEAPDWIRDGSGVLGSVRAEGAQAGMSTDYSFLGEESFDRGQPLENGL